MDFFVFTLPNGIRCIHKRVRSSVAHCALTINAGSRDELPGEHGIAHLAEHAIFKGTEHRRAFHINSRLENLGGELNAFTTKEDTTVHATTLRGDFPKAAELIADVVFHSTFPRHEVEREKQVVLDEINTYRDIPQEMIYDRFEELMFAGSPLAHNILGTARSVKKLDSGAVQKFVARTWTPDQMVFSVIGNISEKTFVRVAERYFGRNVDDGRSSYGDRSVCHDLNADDGWNIDEGPSADDGLSVGGGRNTEINLSADGGRNADSGLSADGGRNVGSSRGAYGEMKDVSACTAVRAFERVAPPAYVPFEEVHKNGNHQAHCIIGNRAYSLSDPRRLPLTLLVNILGGPAANSRLNTVLRERNGLSYNIEAGFSPFSDTGFAGVYFSCEKDKVDRCRELVDSELQRIMETPLTPRQLSTAKKQYIGQFSVSMESNEGYMLGVAKSFLSHSEIDSPDTIARKVNAITADEIMAVAREIFTGTSTLIYR